MTNPIPMLGGLGAGPSIAEWGAGRNELDEIAESFGRGDGAPATAALVEAAARLRARSAAKTWREEIIPELREHAVFKLLQQDPFTRHAWTKPRGYAGDAELLDYIYKHRTADAAVARASRTGRQIYRHTGDGAAPRAVRNRRALIAQEIDRLAGNGRRPRVFSLACGHLREAELSDALRLGGVEITAMDQDPLSVAQIGRDYPGYPIAAEVGSVKDVLRDRTNSEKYDFVYAAGLYDYLDDRVAAALLRALLRLCAPGGKVWVANFAPGIRDAGYMEAFMDWFLKYRSADDMLGLLDRVPPALFWNARTFVEPEGNIVFLEVARPCA